jgi:phospholipid/cholesterol/gamma-HCH transport system substrate-binding protein
MDKNTTVETAVGAVVIVIAAVFFGFAYSASGKGEGAGGYSVTAEFDNAAGVNTGTDVRLAGIKIGTVTGQSLNPQNYQAVITMAIDPKITFSDDTTAKITSEGLLGSNFIALEPGGSETKLAEGGRITYTQGAVDIWSLISQAMFDKSKTDDASTSTGGGSTNEPPPADSGSKTETPAQ